MFFCRNFAHFHQMHTPVLSILWMIAWNCAVWPGQAKTARCISTPGCQIFDKYPAKKSYFGLILDKWHMHAAKTKFKLVQSL